MWLGELANSGHLASCEWFGLGQNHGQLNLQRWKTPGHISYPNLQADVYKQTVYKQPAGVPYHSSVLPYPV